MRIGSNPEKNKKIEHDSYHRIIIPIYIPNSNDYFKNGFEFTRLCVESVIKTKHSKSRLTIVNNGSCHEVSQYLQDLYIAGRIDQLIHHQENVGKIDAIIPVAKTCLEPLITISDGDVLFKDGWIQGVEEVFNVFPEAGMVSPVPHGTTYSNYTSNTLFDAFFKRVLNFQQLCSEIDMLRFAKSIGKEDTMYKKSIRLKYQLTVKRNDMSAVVGCGHFVSTIRNEVFTRSPKSLVKLAYATEADRNYIDIPNEKSKLWRLATAINYAYHIGNKPEQWMHDEFKSISGDNNLLTDIPSSSKIHIPYGIKKFVVNRIWLNRFCRPIFFRWLGLKERSNEY